MTALVKTDRNLTPALKHAQTAVRAKQFHCGNPVCLRMLCRKRNQSRPAALAGRMPIGKHSEHSTSIKTRKT